MNKLITGSDHMKQAKNIRIFLLIAYCTPFAFLAVNGDAVFGTMLFYVIMIVSFSLLCWAILKTNRIYFLYVGNLLSFASSYIIAKLSGLESMGDYFKPFTVYSLIVAISIICMFVHTMVVLIYMSKKRNT